jgi:hypothetical protein
MSKKKELLEIAKEMRDHWEDLPQDGKIVPLLGYDLISVLHLLVAWFEEDCKDES